MKKRGGSYTYTYSQDLGGVRETKNEHETYHIGCNHCFSLYDSDFVLVQIDMRHFIGYTIRNIA